MPNFPDTVLGIQQCLTLQPASVAFRGAGVSVQNLRNAGAQIAGPALAASDSPIQISRQSALNCKFKY